MGTFLLVLWDRKYWETVLSFLVDRTPVPVTLQCGFFSKMFWPTAFHSYKGLEHWKLGFRSVSFNCSIFELTFLSYWLDFLLHSHNSHVFSLKRIQNKNAWFCSMHWTPKRRSRQKVAISIDLSQNSESTFSKTPSVKHADRKVDV